MAADVSVTFDGQMKGLKSSLDGMQSYIKDWGGKIAAIGVAGFAAWGASKVFAGIKAGISAITAEMNKWVESAAESDRINKLLEATVESTGQAAGFTASQIQEMASEMQRLSTFEDDAIVSAQTLILRFKNIKGDEFKRASDLMLDMAAKTGNMEGAAEKLGRVLNNPVKAIRLLTKEGSNLSEAQQQLIKDMVAMGNVAGAQNIILGEMEKAYGGASEAALNAAGGGMKQFENTVDDIRKSLGDELLPVLDDAPKAMNFMAKEVLGATGDIGKAFGGLKDIITDALDVETIGEAMVGTLNLIKDTAHKVMLEFELISKSLVKDIDFQEFKRLTAKGISEGLSEEEQLQFRKFEIKMKLDALDLTTSFRAGVDAFHEHLKKQADEEKEIADAKERQRAADQKLADDAEARAAKFAEQTKMFREAFPKITGDAAGLNKLFGTDIGKKFQEGLKFDPKEAMEGMASRVGEAIGKSTEIGRAVGEGAVLASEATGKKAEKEEPTRAAAFEGLEQLFKRIQSSAATADPKEKTQLAQLEEQRQTKREAKRTADALDRMEKKQPSGSNVAVLGP